MLENETMLYLVLNTSSLENTLQSLQGSDINYLIRRCNTSKYTRNDSFFILNCRDSRSANYFSNEPIVLMFIQ